MIEMTERELLNLKKEIDDTKAKVSELTGKQKYLKKQLLEWKCEDIKDASKKLKSMGEEVEKLTEKINKHMKEVKEQYDI